MKNLMMKTYIRAVTAKNTLKENVRNALCNTRGENFVDAH